MKRKILNNKKITIIISIVLVFCVILTLSYSLSLENSSTPSIYTRDELSERIDVLDSKVNSLDSSFGGHEHVASTIVFYYNDVVTPNLDPTKVYDIDHYTCTNGVVPSWDPRSNSIKLTPSTSPTNCSIFLKDAETLYATILLHNNEQSDSGLNFGTISGNGLYYTSDLARGEDNTRVYYFRGNVDNNWVYFGGYYWRIVRTNSEYGVKLIYSGDGSATDSAYVAQATKYGPYIALKYNDAPSGVALNYYNLGYTYNTSNFTTTPQTDSTVKSVIDSWYTSHFVSNANYLSTTAIYCNAKQQFTYTKYEYQYYNNTSSYPGSKSPEYFYSSDALTRIGTNNNPTFSCLENNKSRYTMSSSTGNALLSKPVALLTADEAAYAGMTITTDSPSNFLRDNASKTWWVMTPYQYYYINPIHTGGSTSYGRRYWTYGFTIQNKLSSSFTSGVIDSTGYYGIPKSNPGAWVRPVTSVKACVIVTEGNGTFASPYMLSDSQC